MEPYIRKNTELRKTAANSFEKDFFKLMNNSVFGKTIENIRKRQNIFLIDEAALESRTWHPKEFRCYSQEKGKTLILRSYLYLQIIFNSSVLQITT